MDFLTTLPLPAGLALLALLDGLSVGTLLIPAFFLIAPGKPRVARILLYLGTITLFYLAVGVLFTLGLVNIIDIGRSFIDSSTGQTVLLVVGLALLATGILMPTSSSRRRKELSRPTGAQQAGSGLPARPEAADATDDSGVSAPPQPPESGRIVRWRERLLADDASRTAVMGVALAAGLVEVASMLPYLVGMTMIADAPIAMPARFGYLAGYCLVMILPALVLLAARVFVADAIDRPLRRLTAWLQRTGAENTAWILGIIGFLLARAGATGLGISIPIIGGG